jgi:intracellular septation protein A
VKANILRAVLIDIAVPLVAYFGLVASGLPAAWALAASAGVSVSVLAIGWARTRRVSTLGVLVLVRIVLGLAIASLTGDARFVLVKDYLVTLVIGLAALATLRLERPFIARVRRDLSPDPVSFDAEWTHSEVFRTTHRRLTYWWVVGLTLEVLVAVVVIYTTPLTVAVITTSVLTPAVLVALIALTQASAAGLSRQRAARATDAAVNPAGRRARPR